jgi:hypothetical protein
MGGGRPMSLESEPSSYFAQGWNWPARICLGLDEI